MAAPAKGAMGQDAFLKAVRQGQSFPVVLLRGSEEYLLRQSLDEYVKRALDPAAAEFDYNEFRSAEVNGETLWNALTTLPFLGKQRLVVLEISGEPRKEIGEVLARYLARPAETTRFVIVAAEGGLGRGGELPAGLVDVEFRPLRDPERQQWAEAYAKRQGMTFDREAVTYLIESSSNSLADLASKLEHAILYLGAEKQITTQVLMKVSGVSSEYTVFNLEDAILERYTVRAHEVARSLLQGGEVVLRLLSFHRGMLLKLWHVSAILRKPESWHRSEVAMSFWSVLLRKQLFKKEVYLKAAKEIGVQRIRQAIVGLLELEVAAKTGASEPYLYYEWIWNITSKSRKQVEPLFQPKS